MRCPAVNNLKLFLGWNEKAIHINIPLGFGCLIVGIYK